MLQLYLAALSEPFPGCRWWNELQASARHVYMTVFFRMGIVQELYLSVVSPWTSKYWQQPVPSYPCCLAKIRLCASGLSARPLSCFSKAILLVQQFFTASLENSVVFDRLEKRIQGLGQIVPALPFGIKMQFYMIRLIGIGMFRIL